MSRKSKMYPYDRPRGSFISSSNTCSTLDRLLCARRRHTRQMEIRHGCAEPWAPSLPIRIPTCVARAPQQIIHRAVVQGLGQRGTTDPDLLKGGSHGRRTATLPGRPWPSSLPRPSMHMLLRHDGKPLEDAHDVTTARASQTTDQFRPRPPCRDCKALPTLAATTPAPR